MLLIIFQFSIFQNIIKIKKKNDKKIKKILYYLININKYYLKILIIGIF